jgi:hypothetical protein
MQSINSLKTNIYKIDNQNFEETAIEIFRYQYEHNPVYQEYVDLLEVNVFEVKALEQIPFLPIRFFKTHQVVSGSYHPQHIFESSGTTEITKSKHFVQDLQFYKNVSVWIFEHFFSSLEGSVLLGLLPSYLERNNSSLVYMVDQFIRRTGRSESGFFLDDYDRLVDLLNKLEGADTRIYLFGVTFALLELSTNFYLRNENLTILETGGMKGRGREMVREELHHHLKRAFPKARISSEYGMTELLSQAYLDDDGYFQTPPWMKVMIRDINDPFSYLREGRTGAINIIDFSNVHSCAFIETEDLGIDSPAGFRVLGRLDNSDVRGCNLLVS